MIFLIVVAFSSFAQDLLIDSTNGLFNDRISIDFDQVFSVWFTTLTRHNRKIEIFSIIQYEQLELRLTLINNQMYLESSNSQIQIDIKNYPIGIWFHLVVSRHENDYFIEFIEPFTRKIQFDQKLQKSIIVSNFNQYKACLIYNQRNNFNFNISRIINFQQLQPQYFTQFIYFSNTSLQFYARRQYKEKQNNIILQFSANQLCEFEIFQYDDEIWIGSQRFDVNEIQLDTWFSVIIKFEIKLIEVRINFFDKVISNQIENEIIFTLFYLIIIPLQKSDYQFISINYNFNIKLPSQSLTLKEIEICNKNEYLNLSNNKCYKYLELPNIFLTEKNYLINELDYINKGVLFDKTYYIIQQSLIDQMQIQNLLEHFIQGEVLLIKQSSQEVQEQNQLALKDIYILQQNDQQILCQQYYFGGKCQNKVKKCRNVNSKNYCISCDYKYSLNLRRCFKCPQNCLICQYSNKQIKCLIPYNHYYVNQIGITRYCECQYCQYGKCIDEQEYLNLKIHDKCIIKICPDNTYFNIIKQACFEIPEITQMYLNYYTGFLDSFNYDLKQTQLQICLLKDHLTSNSQLNKFYFTQQLINNHKQSLNEGQIQQQNYYYMNRYNKKCMKKRFDPYGSTVCGEYNSGQQTKCSTPPCDYALYLQNITLKMSSNPSILYEGIVFENINQLVLSIKDIGVQYSKVLIDISIIWAFETPFNTIYDYDINLNKSIIPEHLKYAHFNLNIKFSNLILKTFPILYLEINFINSINILNQEINFELYLKLITNSLFLQNLTIQNDYSLISFQNCNSIIISNTYVFGNSNILFSNISDLIIDGLYIQSKQLNTTMFLFKNIGRLVLQNIFIQINDIEQSEVFYLNTVFEAQINNLRIILNNTINSTIVLTERCILFQASEIQITDSQNQNSIYFWNDDCQHIIFQNIQIKNQLATNSSAFVIDSIKCKIDSTKIQFRHILNTELLKFKGDELQIKNCIFQFQNLQIIRKIIDIDSRYSMIEFLVLQDWGVVDKLYSIKPFDASTFIIKIKITDSGFIKHLKILNFFLNEQGLLHMQCNKVLIKELEISDISLPSSFDLCLIQFEGCKAQSIYNIQNSLFHNIQLFTNQRVLMSLICMKFMNKITINSTKIYQINSTNINQGSLLTINSTKALLTKLTVINCNNINLLDIQSQAFYLNNLNYYLSSGYNLFVIVGKQDQILSFDNINLINIYGSLLFVNTSNSVIISFYKVNIFKFSQPNLFIMQGMYLKVKFQYIMISESLAQEFYDDQYLFQFFQGQNLEMDHLYLNQINTQVLKVKFSQIVALQFILINNISNTQRNTLILIIHSQIYLQNIYFYKVINEFGIIQLFQNYQITYMENIFIQNCSNINRVISFDEDDQQESRIKMSNIYITSSQIKQIFVFYSQRKIFKLFNLYMNDTPSYIITGQVNILQIHNSIINDCQDLDFNLFANQSEMIGENMNHYKEMQIHNSLLFNPAKQFIYSKSQLIMSLSFKIGKSVLKVQKVNEFSFIIKKIHLREYFYVPTGCLISNYKRINFFNLQNEQVYKGFYLVIQESMIQNLPNNDFICQQLQYYNDQLIESQDNNFQNFSASQIFNNIDQVFKINPFNNNYTVFSIICRANHQTISLQYKVRSFPCQLGEILLDEQCIVCNLKESKYSVTYNATKCQYIDYVKIKSAKPGLIKLQQNYWRYKFNSHIIEFCDSEYCKGGWVPGDQSCVKSRIGALCKECDIYNIKGDGHYTNNNGECIQCQQLNLRFIFQFLFAIVFQLFLVLTAYYSNSNISRQYLMYRVGFREFYQILYRQSVNQPSIIIKMYTNYLFMLYTPFIQYLSFQKEYIYQQDSLYLLQREYFYTIQKSYLILQQIYYSILIYLENISQD